MGNPLTFLQCRVCLYSLMCTVHYVHCAAHRTIRWQNLASCSQIFSPWLGAVVEYGIGLSYRSASLCSLAVRYDNPLPEATISPSQGLRISLLTSPSVHLLLHPYRLSQVHLLLNNMIIVRNNNVYVRAVYSTWSLANIQATSRLSKHQAIEVGDHREYTDSRL
jgi:hypothetical protein